ncbi:hypothetical protein ACFW1A_29280 [Kitasatospora sp. NPDC058965]|uniref:hypothetical protein n=1 Tax=Kitasatospora sp. NPDC058965 TaxID=3346682 RepID=UPI0036D18695
MDGNTVALLVAAVGVLGTLSSPVISQRLSARTKREEAAMQRADAEAVREQARREAVVAERKAAYIAFNAASRRYRVEMMNYLHAVDAELAGDLDRAELREARRTYSACFAEVQILATDEVLASIEEISGRLSRAYLAIKRLENGAPDPGWSFDETRGFLIGAWDHWLAMRQVMRAELGLDERPLL